MCRVLKCDKYRITTYYSNSHKAIDMVKYYSSTCPITAHTEGTVVFCQTGQKNNPNAKGNASYGNCVKIKHPNGYYTLYAHMEKVYVKYGQHVSTGQEIGFMGNTGRSFGAHLHFEIRTNNETRINPQPYLNCDLPGTNVCYQTYDNVKNKWLPVVKAGSKDYAGNLGNGQSGLRIDSNIEYRSHDKVKKKWLPWVKGSSSYAGNLPNDMDAIQIKNRTYRVYDNVKKKWLPWITGTNDYDGNSGNSIGGVQIK